MAEISIEAFDLKDVTLIIGTDTVLGADDYKQHVSSVTFTPTAASVSWKPLSPNYSFTSRGLATWECTTSIGQDWESDDSLAVFLLEHEGETRLCKFEPRAGGASFTCSLVLSAPSIGGAVDTPATSEVTHGVVGKPVRVPAA